MEPKITPEAIIHSAGCGIIATDVNGRITFFNQAAEDLIGQRFDIAVGANIHRILPHVSGFKTCRETGKPESGCIVTVADRKLVVDVSPIVRDGTVIGLVGNLRPLECMDAAVHQSEPYKQLRQQLDAVFSASSDGLWVSDAAGTVVNVNTVSEIINGVRARDVIGKSCYDLVREGIYEGIVTPEVIRTKRQVSTLSHLKRTGKRVLVTGTPVFDDDGNISLIVSNERDLTHLNTVKEELEQSRRVAEKYKAELAELNLLELKQQEIVAESPEMKKVLHICVKLAKMEASNILIQGESGTGKGLLAKFIHENGKRKSTPFIQINCAAIPDSLLEAELFGYEKGAFTGAREQGKIGLFELAHEGTLFLDEIGDLPINLQAKLLKYLDDQEILPLGATRHRKVDCSVIAATNRNLEKLADQGRFRQDLFFRLNTFTINIPPLRHRTEDIVKMSEYFLDKFNTEYQLSRRMTPAARHRLQAHPFPGNVRELQNIIKKAVVLSEDDVLDEFIDKGIGSAKNISDDGLPSDMPLSFPIRLSEKLQALEKGIYVNALKRFISTRQIARNLGTSQSSVMRKIKKYGLD